MSLTDWTRTFPALGVHGYRHTSNETPEYNCIAWAADDNTQWWEPDNAGQWYWPEGVVRKYNLSSYVAAYRSRGYQRCANPNPEDGFEKIALYLNNEKRPMHAAKLLANGKWSSKLGTGDDIEHTLDGLNGDAYGTHSIYMKRRIPKPSSTT